MTEETRTSASMRSLIQEVEAEVARLVGYVNDQVVPEVRRGSSTALRAVATELGRIAEHLERGAKGKPPAPAGGGR